MLTPRQQRGLAALMENPTIQQAAAKSGVSYPCLRKWLASDPEFIEAYREAMSGLVRDASDSLKKNMSAAVSTMTEIMNSHDAAPQVRLNASDAVLRNALKFIETQDILQRLAHIEERIDSSDD